MTSTQPICVPPSRYLGPRSPREGPQKGQNMHLGPFWPIQKIHNFFVVCQIFKKLMSFESQRKYKPFLSPKFFQLFSRGRSYGQNKKPADGKSRFWPVLAQKDLEKFSASGAKKNKKNSSKSLLKAPQMVCSPQNPQFCVRGPPGRRVWAHFVGKMAQIGVKKRDFLKKISPQSLPEGPRRVWDPQNPKIKAP